MAMVSNKFLGALAVRLGLHTHLRHFSSPLQSQITHYAEEIQTAEEESDGAVDYWVGTKDPPKVVLDLEPRETERVGANRCGCSACLTWSNHTWEPPLSIQASTSR